MSEDQGPEAFVKLRSAERRTGLNGLRGRDEFQAEWRNEGLTGTYLFELEAHPGWPQGRSLTTAGSKPIRIIERPRRGRPWSRSFLSDGTIADVPAAASPLARNIPAEHSQPTAGNPKQVRRRQTQHTRYDGASQLTAATHSYETNESYSFDATGNRTNTGYSTGANNQLSSDGTYNYLYDNAGNLTKKTTISIGAYVTYTWDYHNRLTDVQAYNSSNVLQSHQALHAGRVQSPDRTRSRSHRRRDIHYDHAGIRVYDDSGQRR